MEVTRISPLRNPDVTFIVCTRLMWLWRFKDVVAETLLEQVRGLDGLATSGSVENARKQVQEARHRRDILQSLDALREPDRVA